MDPFSLEINSIVLIVLFIMPGFISMGVNRLFFPTTHAESTRLIIQAITYSAFNYAIWLIPLLYIEANDWIEARFWLYYITYLVVLFVSPTLLALCWIYVQKSTTYSDFANHPTERPWDYFFGSKEECWVKVFKTDGTVIGGEFYSNSFASSSPAEESIYIQKQWIINNDGAFVRPIKRSKGLLIFRSEISHLEFRSIEDESYEQ